MHHPEAQRRLIRRARSPGPPPPFSAAPTPRGAEIGGRAMRGQYLPEPVGDRRRIAPSPSAIGATVHGERQSILEIAGDRHQRQHLRHLEVAHRQPVANVRPPRRSRAQRKFYPFGLSKNPSPIAATSRAVQQWQENRRRSGVASPMLICRLPDRAGAGGQGSGCAPPRRSCGSGSSRSCAATHRLSASGNLRDFIKMLLGSLDRACAPRVHCAPPPVRATAAKRR